MVVPKTPMHENGQPVPRQDNVRPPRQVPLLKPEPQAEAVQGPADRHFGFGVFAADGTHNR
jgi:hypothetical protein